MNLLKRIKEKISSLELARKLALVVLAPLALIAFILSVKKIIQNALDSSRRDNTDKQHEEMQSKMKDLEIQSAKHEGRVQELEKQKKEALNKADQDDPISFHNRRKK